MEQVLTWRKAYQETDYLPLLYSYRRAITIGTVREARLCEERWEVVMIIIKASWLIW